MSCRETAGGKAVSAASSLLGIPTKQFEEIVHRSAGQYRAANPDADDPADPTEVLAFYQGLERVTHSMPGHARTARVQARINAASEAVLDGRDMPSNAMLHAWRHVPAEWDTQQVIAAAASSDPDGFTREQLVRARETIDRILQSTPGSEPRQQRPPRPYHKRFANFNAAAVTATEELFTSRPSRMSHEERDEAFRGWISKMSTAYGMEPPELRWHDSADDGGGGYYAPAEHAITLSPNRPSVTTLMHEFRHALQHHEKGAPLVSTDREVDARAWSLSLYHKVRPALFTRLVREGVIRHISVDDLD